MSGPTANGVIRRSACKSTIFRFRMPGEARARLVILDYYAPGTINIRREKSSGACVTPATHRKLPAGSTQSPSHTDESSRPDAPQSSKRKSQGPANQPASAAFPPEVKGYKRTPRGPDRRQPFCQQWGTRPSHVRRPATICDIITNRTRRTWIFSRRCLP